MTYNVRKAFNGKNAKRKRTNTFKKIKTAGSRLATTARLAKTVASTVAMLNAEKRRIDISAPTTGTNYLGQVNINANNFYVQDFTPLPAEGVTVSNRTGASIKLHSSFGRLQIVAQTNATTPIRIRCMMIQVMGTPVANINTFVTNIFSPNPFVMLSTGATANIVDYNSQFDPDYFGTYKILYKKSILLPVDSYSGATQTRELMVPLKYNKGKGHHIRFDKDSITNVNGQLLWLMLADAGNTGGTASTNTNMPTVGTSTGVRFNFTMRHFYYDN